MKTHKQYRYRIYTEDKIGMGPVNIQKTIADYFDGFTVFLGIGFWQGKKENNSTIEIISVDRVDDAIETICKKINRLNSQDCCLVTVEPVEVAYV